MRPRFESQLAAPARTRCKNQNCLPPFRRLLLFKQCSNRLGFVHIQFRQRVGLKLANDTPALAGAALPEETPPASGSAGQAHGAIRAMAEVFWGRQAEAWTPTSAAVFMRRSQGPLRPGGRVHRRWSDRAPRQWPGRWAPCCWGGQGASDRASRGAARPSDRPWRRRNGQ